MRAVLLGYAVTLPVVHDSVRGRGGNGGGGLPSAESHGNGGGGFPSAISLCRFTDIDPATARLTTRIVTASKRFIFPPII